MMPSEARSPDSGARRKSVLYCPECGHASPIGGDWHVERGVPPSGMRTGGAREHTDATGRERVVYSCPECENVITTRFVRGLVRA